jgi:hypothetical protein
MSDAILTPKKRKRRAVDPELTAAIRQHPKCLDLENMVWFRGLPESALRPVYLKRRALVNRRGQLARRHADDEPSEQ